MKKSWRSNKSMFVKKLARVKNAMHLKWDDGATTVLLVAIGVSAAVMLTAAIKAGQPENAVTTSVQAKPSPAPVPATKATVTTTSTTVPEKSAKASASLSAVTVTGCLEHNKDAFRLKDTTGENAPKGRSWKSGFLKKNAASIEVVDRANAMQLSNHVGERVVLTGTLVDREMQVRSLRRVAASCNQEA
jgi:hypothetical protein